MSKKRTQLQNTIIGNVITITLAFLMLVSVSFAWFVSGARKDVMQEMSIGKFQLKLTEGGNVTAETVGVQISSAFPMTFTKAVGDAEGGLLPVYTLEIANTGTVDAQFRLSAQMISDEGYNLATSGTQTEVRALYEQVRFAYKAITLTQNADLSFSETMPIMEWTEGGFILPTRIDGEPPINDFGGAIKPPLNFKQCFNSLLLSPVTTDADEQHFVAKSDGYGILPFKKQGEIYTKTLFKFIFWLDENATVQSTGAITQENEQKNNLLKFRFKVHGLQLGGGATFLKLTELDDLPHEKMPEAI